jgi:low temperature requirement protein LtrA
MQETHAALGEAQEATNNKPNTFRRTIWQRPNIHTEEDERLHRKVSWLELFYDLVFVAVIAQLSHYLAAHMTWDGLAGYALLFVPVWWVWIASTYYNERFETFGLETRVFTFLQMLPVAAMAVFAYYALGAMGAQFALAYATARIIHIFLWARAGYYVPVARPMTNRYAIAFSISVVLFIISAFVQPPLRYVLWIIGLTIDIAAPVLTLRFQRELPRLSTTKLPERFGLLVILVLGETVVGAVNGMAGNHNLTWAVGFVAVLGMALAFALWWVYFDFVARRPARPSVWWTLFWGYGHLPLVMGLVAVGAGVLVLVSDLNATNGAKQLIAVAMGLTLTVTGLLEVTLRREPNEPTHAWISPLMKIIVGGVAATLALFSSALTVPGLLLILLALVATQIAYGVWVWFTQDIPVDDSIS